MSNYRTPSVFKPLFYLTLPVAEKKRSSGKRGEEEEERKTKVQALVQLRQQAPVIHITHRHRHTHSN